MKLSHSIHLGWLMVLIAGCATSKQISGPNGEVLHSIDCSGYYSNIGTCLEKAGKICGSRGYDILLGGAENHGTGMSSGQFGLFAAPIVSREIIIRCKSTGGLQNSIENTSTTQQN
ncbi:MAG: hypothetical protein HDR50_01800 [Desulfovibrio sp.]|uniref:hypothetical protein n=1 Tax=Desulfovibrio sp. TaxID=885 RepID=UPI001A719A92|nr:hypothetical protein [Desulfovibrio sp.]MBD5416419.1 hypothetical protein [Desulfovibrio sp.]